MVTGLTSLTTVTGNGADGDGGGVRRQRAALPLQRIANGDVERRPASPFRVSRRAVHHAPLHGQARVAR